MKWGVKVKNGKEIDLFEEMMLNIPVVEKCDFQETVGKEALFEIEMSDGREFDVMLHFMEEGYPKQIQNLAKQITDDRYHMIAAAYISKISDKICKEKNIGYLDRAGNCLFKYHSLYVSVTGNKNNEVSKRALKSIFERTSVVSSRILRLMFEDVHKMWRMKELGEKALCSIGQVSKVKEFLVRNIWLEQTKEGMILVSPEDILKEWARIYGDKPNEVVEYYSLDKIPELEAKLCRMKKECGIEYYLTGFSGGVRYQPVVRYRKIHCYIRPEDLKEAVLYLGLKKVDSGANVSIIIPYDECVLQDSRVIGETQVVSPVQIYLDCKELKGRGEELAEAVLTKEIMR